MGKKLKGPYRLSLELSGELESRALASATKTETEVVEVALRSHFSMEDPKIKYSESFERLWSRRSKCLMGESKSRTYKVYLERVGCIECDEEVELIVSGYESYMKYCAVMMIKSDHFKPMKLIDFLSEEKPYMKSWVTF